jgi:O-acetyl-ADP-ribose deacetylase (regulator of RNase III)
MEQAFGSGGFKGGAGALCGVDKAFERADILWAASTQIFRHAAHHGLEKHRPAVGTGVIAFSREQLHKLGCREALAEADDSFVEVASALGRDEPAG